MLQLANQEDVDMLLLGGDLFHLNKPSFATLQKCIELLRRYCFGSKQIEFDIMSKQEDNFDHPEHFRHANYLDENINVSLPVFSIHGNHDDPTGSNPISSIETLSSAGLINYFGKYTNLDNINLSPILLKKGDVQIALYGLGSINEERLHRILKHGKLNYLAPDNPVKWFKMIVVHQNRVTHTTKKHLPERFLTDLPDFVVWGHEHDTRTEAEKNNVTGFYVYQPGSTVRTSLCEGESKAKCCGLLEVYVDPKTKLHKFRLTTKKLKTPRVMIWESIDVAEAIKRYDLDNTCDAIEEFAKQKVEKMIEKAFLEHTGDPLQPKLPLIRLRLEYIDENENFHVAKFNANFSGRVANPTDVVHFVKKKVDRKYDDDVNLDLEEMNKLIDNEAFESVNMGDIINEYFDRIENEKDKLSLLSQKSMSVAVKDFVEKETTDAIDDMFKLQKEKAKKYLMSLNSFNEDSMKDYLKEFREKQLENQDELNKVLRESRKGKKTTRK